MGCTPSADARKEEALEAAQRINDALATCDRAVEEGRLADAVRIIDATRAADVPSLIGREVTAYTARLSTRLGALHFAQGDFRTALREFQAAARVSLEQARVSREGSYLMVLRYAEASVGCARCHLGLLGEAQQRVEAAAKEVAETSARNLTARQVAAASSSPFARTLDVASMPLSPKPTNTALFNPLDIGGAGPGALGAAPSPLHEPQASNGDVRPVHSGTMHLALSDVDFSDTESNLGVSVPASPGTLDPMAKLQLCEKEARRRIAVTERRLVECVQCIDEVHSHRSEMLIDPLTMLAELYERLGMWDVAERTVRKLSGVFMVKYGHSHPAYRRTHIWLNRLADQSEARAAERAVTRIVATWKMRKAIVALAHRLGRDTENNGADSASSSESEEDERSDVFNAHASLGRSIGASTGRTTNRAGAGFLDVFSRATNADDETDGDALLRRQLEAVPKGPATNGTWITPEGPLGSSGVHAVPEDQPAASPAAAESSGRSSTPPPAFDVVAVHSNTHAAGEEAVSTPLRTTRSATRGRVNGRVVASLVFAMSPAEPASPAASLGRQRHAASNATPSASPVAATRSRPIGLWEVS